MQNITFLIKDGSIGWYTWACECRSNPALWLVDLTATMEGGNARDATVILAEDGNLGLWLVKDSIRKPDDLPQQIVNPLFT